MNLLATIASTISIPLATPLVFGPGAYKRFGATLRLEDREMPKTPWHYRLAAPIWVIAPQQEQIEEADIPVMAAKFGRFGNRSYCDRVWIEIEHAARFSDYYTIALLPAAYFDPKHDEQRRSSILRITHAEVLRYWIDGALLGEQEPSCLIVWRRTVNKMPGALIWRIRSAEDFERGHVTMRTHGWQPYLAKLHDALKEKPISLPSALEPQRGRPVITVPLSARDAQTTALLANRPLLRACVHGGGQCVIFKAMNPAGTALLEGMSGSAKLPIIHSENDPKVIGYTQTDRLLLRLNMLVRYPQLLDRKIDHLRAQGADVEESHDLRPWLARRLRRHAQLDTVPFEQTIRLEEGEWETLHERTGVRTIHANNYADLVKRAKDLPWKKWGFHNDDLARIWIKGSALYVADQGTGKTRFTLSMVKLRGAQRNLLVLESRLIQEFLNEVKAIGFPVNQVHIIEDVEDARPEKLKQINLVAYSRLGRGVVPQFSPQRRKSPNLRCTLRGATPSEGRRRATLIENNQDKSKPSDEPYKRTLAHVLRKTRFNTIFCDEGHKLANSGAQQTQAVALLRAKHVIVMSGTPIKNYPDGALALWMRAVGERTSLCPYSDHTPILLDYQHRAMSGRKRYMDLFVSYKTVTSQFTGKKSRRKVPLIPEESLDLWRDQLSLIMCRRSMHEPDVSREIPLPKSDIEHILVDMNDHHVNFYHWWLDQFFEWLQNQIQLEAAGRGGVGSAAIFAQLGKLDFATGFPQAPQLQIPGAPTWGDALTTKQRDLLERLSITAPQGYKSIVFAMHPDFLELMQEELEDRSVKTAVVHGAISMTKRNAEIKRYRTDDSVNVLLASFDAANTGYNIPEADMVYGYDWPWQPSTMDQAEKRMIRPGWLTEERKASGAQPMIRRMVQLGGLDEYKRQLVYLKAQGADQAINQQQAEFDAESWLSYRDFSIKMLRERGYKI